MRVHSAAVQSPPMLDLNTTPLIDVMLVLLVMLIITIPIQSHAVKLDLPGPGPVSFIQPVKNEVEITRAGAILWNGQPISRDALKYNLRRSQQMRKVPELHLRPDPQARYEVVDDVLGIIKRERVKKFGLVGNERYARW